MKILIGKICIDDLVFTDDPSWFAWNSLPSAMIKKELNLEKPLKEYLVVKRKLSDFKTYIMVYEKNDAKKRKAKGVIQRLLRRKA